MYKFRPFALDTILLVKIKFLLDTYVDVCSLRINFTDHGVSHGNYTDGSMTQLAPKVRVNTLPMDAVQGILAVLDS